MFTPSSSQAADTWLANHSAHSRLSDKQANAASGQFGTLGSGNHFVELSYDEVGNVWLVLRSGSRGVGNQLASMHIAKARKMARDMEVALEDPDLAYFVQGTPEFEAYIADMLWAQDWALANRYTVLKAASKAILKLLPPDTQVAETIQCHHNFAAEEVHGGKKLWITRKGAIRARVGDRGIIPGSVGTSTFLVTGLGNPDSWESCSHGAGRHMSRGEARRTPRGPT
jgi:RNA-splicing ligase RtcB